MWQAPESKAGFIAKIITGQPPIHPRVIAALWLYGMMRKMRTSRILEYACRHNIDFIWLAEGHTPDHSKLAEFFTHNKKPLKSLFKQVCRMAMTMGLVRPGTVAFDATRVKAANSRFIVDSNVLGCINDTNELVAAVDRTTDMLGEKTGQRTHRQWQRSRLCANCP